MELHEATSDELIRELKGRPDFFGCAIRLPVGEDYLRIRRKGQSVDGARLFMADSIVDDRSQWAAILWLAMLANCPQDAIDEGLRLVIEQDDLNT